MKKKLLISLLCLLSVDSIIIVNGEGNFYNRPVQLSANDWYRLRTFSTTPRIVTNRKEADQLFFGNETWQNYDFLFLF
jgi:hypothetical protein